jgi:hypothetical protein
MVLAAKRRGEAVALTLALTLALAVASSCSGGSSSAAGGSGGAAGPTPTYGVFSGHLALNGEIKVQGTFNDTLTSRMEMCAAYVAGAVPATTLWVVPSPNSAALVGGHVVTFTAGVPSDRPSSGYHGPGTYAQPSATVADLIIDNASFVAGDDARTTINVSSDGSGSLSFTGMIDTSTDAAESGSETWMCSG